MTDTTVAAPAVDAKTFWRTLGERAIGMTIVTAAGVDGPAGFLGLSAAHVAADPPTLLVSIDRKTGALAAVLESGAFAVNTLPASATDVADAFSGKGGPIGAARFADGAWTTLATGAPVYGEALGVFDCRVVEVIERGNISIVIGAVVATRARGEGDPLVFFRGKARTDFVTG